MVSNRITDGVGKKIVDALKKQTDSDVLQPRFTAVEQPEEVETPEIVSQSIEYIQNEAENEGEDEPVLNAFKSEMPKPTFHFSSSIEQSATQFATNVNDSFAGTDFDDFELPANVEILRQLISKLPSNVSKQTGAQIIKQTMEALGISMKTVLQEAQQVQENINASARECQSNISEYRRQIGMLENQTQKLHRQYSMVNDIISLFLQAN